jgi:hypothetical protein
MNNRLHVPGVPKAVALGICLIVGMSSCSQFEDGPIVRACIALGTKTGLSNPANAATECGCFDHSARRYLDTSHYQALVRAAEISLANDGAERRSLVSKAVKDSGRISASEIAVATADFLMLIHKHSAECSAENNQ